MKTFCRALLLVLAVSLALASLTPAREAFRPRLVDALIVPAWLVTAVAAPRLLPADAAHGTRSGTLAVVCLLLTIAIGLAFVSRHGPAVAAAVAPLLLLVLPAVHTRQQLSLLVAIATLGLVVVTVRRTRPRATA